MLEYLSSYLYRAKEHCRLKKIRFLFFLVLSVFVFVLVAFTVLNVYTEKRYASKNNKTLYASDLIYWPHNSDNLGTIISKINYTTFPAGKLASLKNKSYAIMKKCNITQNSFITYCSLRCDTFLPWYASRHNGSSCSWGYIYLTGGLLGGGFDSFQSRADISNFSCEYREGDEVALYKLMLLTFTKPIKNGAGCIPTLEALLSDTNDKNTCSGTLVSADVLKYIKYNINYEDLWRAFLITYSNKPDVFFNSTSIAKKCKAYKGYGIFDERYCGLPEIWLLRYLYLKKLGLNENTNSEMKIIGQVVDSYTNGKFREFYLGR